MTAEVIDIQELRAKRERLAERTALIRQLGVIAYNLELNHDSRSKAFMLDLRELVVKYGETPEARV